MISLFDAQTQGEILQGQPTANLFGLWKGTEHFLASKREDVDSMTINYSYGFEEIATPVMVSQLAIIFPFYLLRSPDGLLYFCTIREDERKK